MTKVLALTKAKVVPKARAPTVLRRTPEPVMRLQAALRVGAVNDPAEHEADRMADRVVRDAGPTLQDVRARPASVVRAVEDQPKLDQLDTGTVPADQADVEVPKQEDVATEDLGSAELAELESGGPEETGGDGEGDASPLRRAPEAAVGHEGGRAPADVSQAVANPGRGRPLPRHLRARVEPHFGVSFGNVRLHDTAHDQRIAARIGARAFAHKHHIWLGRGEKAEDTRLISHELTHVVQQTKGSGALKRNVIRRFPGEGWLEDKARHIPGYTLMTVLIGRKLISGDRVQMTAENLLGGLMGLLPGGTLIFDRLKEARVIQEVFTWVRTRLHALNLTGGRVRNVLSKIPGDLSWTSPFASLKRIFGPLVRDLLTFVGEIKDKVLEFIIRGALKLAGPYADKIWGVLQKAGDTIKLILSDPLAFAKNLISAVVGGFGRFARNILEHLKRGLLGWLFGSLQNAGIELPAKLDFKGLMSIALQVLGLTYANFRKRLVKKLGPKGERMVLMLEKSVEVVKILLTKGFVGIWQKLLTMIDNFRQTVIGGITEMVITTVVTAGLKWLAGLSNPVGAVVKVVLAIYDMVVAFLERLEQILDVANSIFSSIGKIARGQVTKAAEFIEKAIGGSVPVVISFLAAALGLGGISKKIRNIIKKLQKPVNKAMDKLLTFLKKKAKKLFSKLVGAVNKKRKLPAKKFKIGKAKHTVLVEKKGKKVETYVASDKNQPGAQAAHHKDDKTDAKKKIGGKTGDEAALTIDEIDAALAWSQQQTDKKEKGVLPDTTRESMNRKMKALKQVVDQAAERIEKAAKKVTTNDALDEKTKKGLVRAVHARPHEIEGKYGTYGNLKKKLSGKKINGEPYTATHEIDHTIEKRFPKAILENLAQIDRSNAARDENKVKGGAKNRATRSAKKKAEDKKANPKARTNKKAAYKLKGEGPPFAKIGTGKFAKIGEDAKEFPSVVVYKMNHIGKKGDIDHIAMMKKASREQNPHQYVKDQLIAQFNKEQAQMQAKLDGDTGANARHKSDIKTALKNVQDINARIYELNKKETQVDDRPKTPADEAKSGADNLLFGGSPNFSEDEGIGSSYNSQKSKSHKWFERDHIVDKSYPNTARFLKLLRGDDTDRITDQIKRETKKGALSKKVGNRLKWLKGQKLYSPGSNMAKYTTGTGYSVILYSVIAKRVNSRLSGPMTAGDFEKQVGTDSIDKLSTYVRRGDKTALADARKERAKAVDQSIEDRALHHALVVGEEYKAEPEKVKNAQATKAEKDEAQAQMTKIVARLHKHLADARTNTGKLTLN